MKNGCNTSESLCATCTRCRALPDPAGCAFHRRHWQTRELEGHPYSRAVHKVHNNGDKSIIVQECADYIDSGLKRDNSGRRHCLSREDEARVYELRQQGLEWAEIARRTNIPSSTAHKAAERYEKRMAGLIPKRHAPNQKMTPQMEWRIYKLRQSGMSYKRIAKQVKISHTTVREAYYRVAARQEALC